MQSNLSSARTAPASSAAAIVNVFIVEPGSYVSVTARLRASASAAPTGSLGLNVGTDAIARTSPVRGSIMIAMAPLAWCSAAPAASARSVMNVR